MNEHELQVEIVKFLRQNNIFCFAVPNGGGRSVMQALRLKEEGVVAGVSDLILLPSPRRIIFLELKKSKGGKQSDKQKAFQEKVTSLGWEYYIIRSLKELMEVLK